MKMVQRLISGSGSEDIHHGASNKSENGLKPVQNGVRGRRNSELRVPWRWNEVMILNHSYQD